MNGQAALTAMQLRAAFAAGTCGAIAFSWTDEWWRGGHSVSDWAFGLVDAERRPKPALAAVTEVFSSVPFSLAELRTYPRVSVIVCAYNAADTLDECLTSLQQLTYPDFEVIVVNDGSRDSTGEIARRLPAIHADRSATWGPECGAQRRPGRSDRRDCRVHRRRCAGRSGLAELSGAAVFRSASRRRRRSQPPPPSTIPWLAQCVARAPGGPPRADRRLHGGARARLNLAVRREALSCDRRVQSDLRARR